MDITSHRSSSASTTLPDLHSDAAKSYDDGIDEVDLAVLANPNKLQPEIQKLSEHEAIPDVTEEEMMHFDDVSENANDILMKSMETAGFHDNQTVANPDGGFVPHVDSIAQNPTTNGFYNIDQPAPQQYTEVLEDNVPQNSFNERFTAPQSDLDASGMATNKVLAKETQSARTQPVRVNFGDNVVNTFDNSIMAATQAQTAAAVTVPNEAPVDKDASVSSKSSQSSSSHAQTESDFSGHRRDLKERQRQHRKKEKRRRERLPHERTYGELQEERYEDWEKKIQNDVQEAINTEKRELLLLFAEKEAEGHKMLRKFNMSSDINEMRFWFYKLLRDSRTDDEVAHLRSHLVEGTRLLLTLNDKVFDNPLGLSDMLDFPDALSSMLSGSWDRHIRDYVKSKHSLQGPPPQPLKNLGLNFLHLFISHHRKKAAEEQAEKAEREKMQRDAVLAASKNGNSAQSPYDAIFGNYRTNLMRGREGINPMELPHYATNMQQNNDPSYQAFLQYKRAKDQAEFQAFMDAKSQSKNTNQLVPTSIPQSVPKQFAPKPTTTVSKQPPPSFLKDSLSRMNVSPSPLPNDLGAPDVASIDGSADFRAPASHKNSVTSAPSTRASNSGLAGNTTVSKVDKTLLSTSAAESSTSSSSSSRPPPPPPSSVQLQVPSRKPIPNTLPRAYQEISPGAKILQSIGKSGAVFDERQVSLPPVPTITRERVQKLQEQLAKQAADKAAEKAEVQKVEAQKNLQKQVPVATVKENFKAIRPVDREKIAKLVQNAKPKPKFEAPASETASEQPDDNTKSESSSTQKSEKSDTKSDTKSDSRSQSGSNDSATENSESEYDRILREMEEECEDMDSQETVSKLNDVKIVPLGAHLIDNNSKDNRIIDMLKMFQSFMAEPPKGTRPTAQSSMFSDIDSLLAVDGAENMATKKKSKNRRKRIQIGESGDSKSESTASPQEEEEDGKSSTASFKLNSENQDLARQKMDSNGRFIF